MEYTENESLRQYLSKNFEKITWEEKIAKLQQIATGPFNDRHKSSLVLDIKQGLRPELTEDTPPIFADLMKRCWSANPSDRPSIHEIKKCFDEWLLS
ncbi:2793_t:CDS:2 [Acaulospora colombiana]|uniref:2793_t:CDS:1 n=1 Tax=Acaulospora colombiana TaxID=27376 RepID=A0ACA9KVN0_9GLOM|nr:2793_t:CDS:2 [Acaulospora colombiana]